MMLPPPARSGSPTRLDWLAAALVVVAAVAFAVIRVQSVNLPWHLATARLAHEVGQWPVKNTFSYTYPEHPIFQQYPAFQTTMLATLRWGGYEAMSLVSGLGWVAVLLLFVRWGGPFRAGAVLHVFWMLGLYALWRRMMVRPDLFSMIALGIELCALDAWSRGRRWALALVPLAHFLWVNSHQLFPLSLVVQAAFVAHLLLLRTRLFPREAPPPPVAPAVLAFGASVALTFATPLGVDILQGPARTAKSLAVFRDNVAEFRRVWTMPLEFGLALATGLPATYALARARRRADPFDMFMWLLSLVLVVAAVRGLMFFGVVSIAVFQRASARCRAAGIPLVPGLGAEAARVLGVIGFVVTALLGANTIFYRWVRPPLSLGGTQPGLGRSIGGWGESMTAFLRATPPPGRMMNVGASAGDLVILDAPGIPVFVDSRLETYPVDFLREVIASDKDDAALARLTAKWDVQWIVAEHFRAPIRARVTHLLGAGWAPVYVDSDYLILVRDTAANASYVNAHRLDLARAEPIDLVAAPAALRAQQRAHFAKLMAATGAKERAEEQRRAALAEAGSDGAAAFDEP
jgi:hypothetical protein